jgi:N-acetylglucosaminyl-diphospho-decaprenol L-rhamnosyltransferase
MKLTVSLVVHEDFSYIESALRSLYATTQTPCDVYVTINTDEARQVERLRTAFPDVRVHVNARPLGFAANHNRILHLAETEYVALLNDDVILQDAALDTLVEVLRRNPQVGVVGPALQNPDGTEQVSVYSDPTFLRVLYKVSGLAKLTHQQSMVRRWLLKIGVTRFFETESLKNHLATSLVPIVKGAVMVVRHTAYTEVGPMDESTVAYGEEADWHWRMRNAGWQVVHEPRAKVTHFGLGQARLDLTGQALVEDRKAILNYFLKHRPAWEARLVRMAIVLFHTSWSILWLPFSRTRSRTHFQTARMGATWRRPDENASIIKGSD